MNDQTYLDSGFNSYFQREIVPANSQQEGEDVSAFDFESRLQGILLNKVVGGSFTSADGRVIVDLENNVIQVSDGNVERVRLGKLQDDSYGILIKDHNDNTLLQIAGSKNIIQSPTTNLQLDFDEERILVKDIGGTPRALIGKGDF